MGIYNFEINFDLMNELAFTSSVFFEIIQNWETVLFMIKQLGTVHMHNKFVLTKDTIMVHVFCNKMINISFL